MYSSEKWMIVKADRALRVNKQGELKASTTKISKKINQMKENHHGNKIKLNGNVVLMEAPLAAARSLFTVTACV